MIDLETASAAEILQRIKELEISMDPKHRSVCLNILDGMIQADAWMAVYPRATKKSANAACPRMLADVSSGASEYLELKRWQITADAAQKLGIDKQSILRRLDQVVERCMEAEPVLDSEGNETGEYRFNATGANRALELLGKELGMFVERKEVSTRKIGKIVREVVYPKGREPQDAKPED